MDDSGDVGDKTNNTPELRYGSISAVILPAPYLDTRFNPDFRAMVTDVLGVDERGEPPNIHRRLLANVDLKGPYAALSDPRVRASWDARLIHMFERAQYTVITACVDKVAWYHKYPTWRGDFYEVLVQCVLERCFYFLRGKGRAEVNIEWKDPNRNDRIAVAYRRALSVGFPPHLGADQLRGVFSSVEINILKKSDRRPGCQLVDMIAAPAMQETIYLNTGRHAIKGDFAKQVSGILKNKKFYRNRNGSTKGYGQVWRP